jgi:hypothetical protein
MFGWFRNETKLRRHPPASESPWNGALVWPRPFDLVAVVLKRPSASRINKRKLPQPSPRRSYTANPTNNDYRCFITLPNVGKPRSTSVRQRAAAHKESPRRSTFLALRRTFGYRPLRYRHGGGLFEASCRLSFRESERGLCSMRLNH